MSSSTSAIKASKSIVESYISSNSEKSDLTTSFTSHSSETEVAINGTVNKIMTVLQHPRIKWIIIAILLCIFAFIYFKTQSKPIKKNVKDDKKDDLNVRLNKNGHPELVEKDKEINFGLKDKGLQEKLEQLDNKQQQVFMKQMFQHQHQHQHLPPQFVPPQFVPPQFVPPQFVPPQVVPQGAPQVVPQVVPQVAPSRVVAPHNEETESSDESEEVFIENENIMNHNLTMEEMNAIDKQLEDVLE